MTDLQFDLAKSLIEAENFHQRFLSSVVVTESGVMPSMQKNSWAADLIRKQGSVSAVLDKVGSNAFVKRKPADRAQYKSYIEDRYSEKKPLQFRIPIGPIKNMNVCGDRQSPDIAEYLMFVQLSRFAETIAELYPFGIKIDVVPDDVRAKYANLCPQAYIDQYITGLKNFVNELGFSSWLNVENGQMRLCDIYKVQSYLKEAETHLKNWQQKNPETFAIKWSSALENARKNFKVANQDNTEHEVSASAWNYMVAHMSEILSGMWSPKDVFPMVYANHPNNYQLFTMGQKKTQLPWQISIPAAAADPSLLPVWMNS